MINEAAKIIKAARRVCAFTGAGISVESGIPPFRGKNGLWNKYNPEFIEIGHFLANPEPSWKLIKEIFYDFFGKARPNTAHMALARLEERGLVKSVITQNIDNLHQLAGSKVIHEFHGTASRMVCLDCHNHFAATEVDLNNLPPECPGCLVGRIKPDFIFFGEEIPEPARTDSFAETEMADAFLVVGTTGEVMPACMIPKIARENGAKIIEINISPSAFTHTTTNIFLQGPATTVMAQLLEAVSDL